MSKGRRDARRRWPLPEGHPSEAELRSLAASRSGDCGGRACSVGPAEGTQQVGGCGCQPPVSPNTESHVTHCRTWTLTPGITSLDRFFVGAADSLLPESSPRDTS